MGLDDVPSTASAVNSAADGKTFDVVVVGACIVDNISYVPRLPLAGETVRATRHQNGFGGKGANQAVAAAKLGSKTALISKLGDDDWGRKYKEHLVKFNVAATNVEKVTGRGTGMAQINVADNGENQIVIVPGANDLISTTEIEEAHELLDSSKILICQLEAPIPATLAALRRFKSGVSILNIAPAPTESTLEFFILPTVLVMNQVEAAAMSKRDVPDIDEAKRALSNFLCLGCRTVIITLGAEGAVFAEADDPRPILVRAPRVEEVLDTTGAGDAFVGALAHYWAQYPDIPLIRKVGGAVTIASMSVQQYGTQCSYPLGKDLRFDIRLRKFDWNYV